MSEQTKSALRAARKCIRTDRAALHACHFDPAIGRVDDTGQMALSEYDAVLAQIDAALAAPAKLTDEQIDLTAVARIIDEQAEDEGLWFRAEHATEAYLQAALRELHAAVERALEGK